MTQRALIIVIVAGLFANAGFAQTAPSTAPSTQPAPASIEELRELEARIQETVDRVAPTVVGVQVGEGQGSGVIISADGYVLTAGHVSRGNDLDSVVILPDGRRLKAKTLGADRGVDSGLMKISEPGEYPFSPMAEADSLALGEWTIAMGHPGGYQKGRPPVVRVGRVLLVRDGQVDTDNPLVGGDSGGPLFDLDGRVVAINSRIGATTLNNTHVPIGQYLSGWDRLASGEVWGGGRLLRMMDRARQPFLGINGQDAEQGCRVLSVLDEGPAQKAGLQEGDVIAAVNNAPVGGLAALIESISRFSAGDEVSLDVIRGGERVAVKVRLGSLPGR